MTPERLEEIRALAVASDMDAANVRRMTLFSALRDLLTHVDSLEKQAVEYETALTEEQDRYSRDIVSPPVLTEPETLVNPLVLDVASDPLLFIRFGQPKGDNELKGHRFPGEQW